MKVQVIRKPAPIEKVIVELSAYEAEVLRNTIRHLYRSFPDPNKQPTLYEQVLLDFTEQLRT